MYGLDHREGVVGLADRSTNVGVVEKLAEMLEERLFHKNGLAEIEAEKRELAALQHRRAPVDMEGTNAQVALAPLPPRPTPEHPATASIIP